VSRTDGEVDHVDIQVIDTGIGMDAGTMTRIFEPFTQADESTTRRYGGSGLGLAICRELVERMGGSISVESTPNAGSRFRVCLSLGRAGQAPPTVGREARVRILTRRPALRDALARQIRRLGYQVAAGEDARTAGSSLTVIDYGTQRAAVDAALDAGHGSGPPPILVVTSGEAEALQSRPGLRLDLLVHKPAHGARLGDALRAAVAGCAADRAAPTDGRLAGHLLLVEDEEVNAGVAQAYFVALGCSCAWVKTGAEAVTRSATERFDLIMMDLNMPDMDGFAATRLIRQREAAGERVPIIAMTAHDVGEYREICVNAGMDGILSKPCTLEECASTLRRWLTPSCADAAADGPRPDERPGSSSCQSNPPAGADDGTPRIWQIDLATVEAMGRLAGDGANGLYSQLVDLFRTSSADSMARLQSAVAEKDFARANALCHKLAAAAANVGALAFGREVRLLGEACLAGDEDRVALFFRHIRAAHPKLGDQMDSLRMRASA
jgi:two-component system sensor histidine kinase BarA